MSADNRKRMYGQRTRFNNERTDKTEKFSHLVCNTVRFAHGVQKCPFVALVTDWLHTIFSSIRHERQKKYAFLFTHTNNTRPPTYKLTPKCHLPSIHF